MGKKIKKSILGLLICVLFPAYIFAETIILKSGRIVEGKLIEKTDEYIKIDFQGIPLTYFRDEIASIDNVEKSQGAEAGKEDARDILISDFLEFSGLKKEIEQLPSLVKQAMEMQSRDQNPEVFAVITKCFIESFNVEAINQEFINKIKENFDENKLKVVLEFFKSPLGTKMVKLGVESSGEEQHYQKRMDFARKLQSDPPVPERVALIKRLVEVDGSIDTTIGALKQLNLSMLRGLSATDFFAQEQKLDPGKIKEIESVQNDIFDKMRDLMEKNHLVSVLYTYQSVSNEDMQQYVVFYESEAGQWFAKLCEKALVDTFATIGEKVGARISYILKNEMNKLKQPK